MLFWLKMHAIKKRLVAGIYWGVQGLPSPSEGWRHPPN